MHLRQLLLTPPRNAPSSPAALAALSPMLARTALLLATLRTVVRTPQPLFSSSAIQLPARKPDPPVTRTRPRLLEDLGIVGSRADGVTSFELMQQASDAGYGGLVYFAFDLLELDGENVAWLPLLERKERLAQLLKGPPAGVVYS